MPLWVAVNEQGRRAVGSSEENKVNAVSHTNPVFLSHLTARALVGVMARASVLPVRPMHQWAFDTARRRCRSW
jgi:hypothetical protein